MTHKFLGNWTTQLRKGLLELCILNALKGERLYGYDIVRQLRGIECLMISEGTVYPILSRLKREGLVSSRLEESPEGPARKYYRLTETGREMLARMNDIWGRVLAGVDELRLQKGEPKQ